MDLAAVGGFEGNRLPNLEAENGGAHVDGLDHPRRLFDLTEALVRRKHSDATIKLVLGGSFARVLGDVWGLGAVWVLVGTLSVTGIDQHPLRRGSCSCSRWH